MHPELLTTLIAGGESLDVEFKSESRQQLPDRDIIRSVVCLANRTGDAPGWLLIGVEDDGSVTGARPRDGGGEIDPVKIRAMIANRTRPSQILRVDVCSLEGDSVLVVQVPVSRQPVGTADGRYLRRAIGGDGRPACVPFHFHEAQSRHADLGLLDYTTLRVPGWAGMPSTPASSFDSAARSETTGGAPIRCYWISETSTWRGRSGRSRPTVTRSACASWGCFSSAAKT